MKIHHELETPATKRPLVLAIGFFDGLHRGHREILRTLLRLRRPGYRAAVVTFRNHPATHLRPDRVPPLLTTVEERVNLIASTGIDELFLIPFDDRVAQTDARDFLRDALLGTLGIRALVVGDNFLFGRGREADSTLARETLSSHSVEVVAVDPVTDSGERISITRIRAAILGGYT
ncbi:MAG: FAD synthetase family protein, partial [Candidatus Eremiobacteraeota bacterium]|nr:FAD synthetase family protein [Candidatus Eremiobacteraeota bacterium]